jgi:hypothetical protein
MERGDGGVLHLHALIHGSGKLSLDCVARTWRFGISRVDRYDPKRTAAWYLSKTLHLADSEWSRFDCSRWMPHETVPLRNYERP